VGYVTLTKENGLFYCFLFIPLIFLVWCLALVGVSKTSGHMYARILLAKSEDTHQMLIHHFPAPFVVFYFPALDEW